MKTSTLIASVLITASAWGIAVAEAYRETLSLKAFILVVAAALSATACTIAIGVGLWQDRRDTRRLATMEAMLKEDRQELKDRVLKIEQAFEMGARSTRIAQIDIAATQAPIGHDTGPITPFRGWG